MTNTYYIIEKWTWLLSENLFFIFKRYLKTTSHNFFEKMHVNLFGTMHKGCPTKMANFFNHLLPQSNIVPKFKKPFPLPIVQKNYIFNFVIKKKIMFPIFCLYFGNKCFVTVDIHFFFKPLPLFISSVQFCLLFAKPSLSSFLGHPSCMAL